MMTANMPSMQAEADGKENAINVASKATKPSIGAQMEPEQTKPKTMVERSLTEIVTTARKEVIVRVTVSKRREIRVEKKPKLQKARTLEKEKSQTLCSGQSTSTSTHTYTHTHTHTNQFILLAQ